MNLKSPIRALLLFSIALSTAHATAKKLSSVKEITSLTEPLPPTAIIDAMPFDPTSFRLMMADGTRVLLSNSKDSIIIDERNGKRRKVSLLFRVRNISVLNSDYVYGHLENYPNGAALLVIHLPTGRRELIEMGGDGMGSSFSMSTPGKTPVIITKSVAAIGRPDGSFIQIPRTEIAATSQSMADQQSLPIGNGWYLLIKGVKQTIYISDATGPEFVQVANHEPFGECSSNDDWIACEAGQERWLFTGPQSKPLRIDNERTILIDTAKQMALLCKDCGPEANDIKLSKLIVRNLLTGALTPVKITDSNAIPAPFFIARLTKGQIGYITKDFGLLAIPESLFWQSATNGTFAKVIKNTKVLVKAKNLEALSKVFEDKFGWQGEAVETGAWAYLSGKRSLRYWRKDRPEEIFAIKGLSEDPSVTKLANPDFLSVQIHTGQMSHRYLLHLPSARLFDFGDYSNTKLEVSPDGKYVLITMNATHWLYSLSALIVKNNAAVLKINGDVSSYNSKDLARCDFPESTTAHATDFPLRSLLLSLRPSGVKIEPDVLEKILAENLSVQEALLFTQVLQRYSLQNEPALKVLMRRSEIFAALAPYVHLLQKNPCLDNFENQTIEQRLQDDLDPRSSLDTENATDLWSVQHLILFAPYIKASFNLIKSHNELANKVARGAEQEVSLNSVPFNKLLRFTRAATAPIFGYAKPDLSEAHVFYADQSARALIMSSEPTSGVVTAANAYGFYQGITKPLSEESSVISWQTRKQNYRAEVSFKPPVDLRVFAASQSSADFEKLHADKKMTGVILLGANRDRAQTTTAVEAYKLFFERRGYKFQNPKVINGFNEWYKNGISTGETDYVIKDASSGSDQRTPYRAGHRATVYEGEFTNGSSTEKIYLVLPKSNRSKLGDKAEASAHVALGFWLREREARGGGPLIYVNSSPFSVSESVREVVATRSKLLTIIPVRGSISGFKAAHDNSLANLLVGLLQKEDWAESQKRIYTNFKIGGYNLDDYLLPNAGNYVENFSAKLEKAIEASISVTASPRNEK